MIGRRSRGVFNEVCQKQTFRHDALWNTVAYAT
jgi:hypothetical protein